MAVDSISNRKKTTTYPLNASYWTNDRKEVASSLASISISFPDFVPIFFQIVWRSSKQTITSDMDPSAFPPWRCEEHRLKVKKKSLFPLTTRHITMGWNPQRPTISDFCLYVRLSTEANNNTPEIETDLRHGSRKSTTRAVVDEEERLRQTKWVSSKGKRGRHFFRYSIKARPFRAKIFKTETGWPIATHGFPLLSVNLPFRTPGMFSTSDAQMKNNIKETLFQIAREKGHIQSQSKSNFHGTIVDRSISFYQLRTKPKR